MNDQGFDLSISLKVNGTYVMR